MKYINVLAVLALMPIAVLAANNFDDEVNAELDRMYDSTAKTGSASKPAAAVQVNVTNASSQGQSQGAEQVQTVTQAQKQPTTVIEASPLTESRADRIRKARQDVEVQTEQKIVEKLELSRIEDERRRSEILFGDRFNQLNNTQQPAAPIVVATPTPAPVVVAPVVVATPTPMPVQEVAPVVVAPVAKEDRLSKEDVRNEVSAALEDFNKEKKPQDKWTMGALLGVGDYPSASNVKGNYAVGFTAGKKFQDRIIVEGSFLYSTYSVEQAYGGGYYQGQYYPRITAMDQYSAGMTAKYQLWQAALRPVVGATMAYTYRAYTDTQFAVNNSDSNSQALDVGAVVGADLDVSETFSLGLDIRYMTNLTNKTSSNFQNSMYQNQNGAFVKQTPIEQINYVTVGLVGRTTF